MSTVYTAYSAADTTTSMSPTRGDSELTEAGGGLNAEPGGGGEAPLPPPPPLLPLLLLADSLSDSVTSAVPRMHATMQPSLRAVNLSPSRPTLSAKVKSEEVDERMVLEVTEVMESERLKVYWARNQKGAAQIAACMACLLLIPSSTASACSLEGDMAALLPACADPRFRGEVAGRREYSRLLGCSCLALHQSMTRDLPWTRGKYRVKREVARYVSRNGGTAAGVVAVEVTKLSLMNELTIQIIAVQKISTNPTTWRWCAQPCGCSTICQDVSTF
mmetsp:Transcript_31261/g.79726  ORF Transcript_31261/g.79726 Transcript_31261/m.79726 type:complete len:275 (-) Transcript_31261:33-857(-)